MTKIKSVSRVALALLAIAASGCSSEEYADTTSTTVDQPTAAEQAAEQVKATLTQLDLELSQQIDRDLHLEMAWTDLRADLESVVADSVRRPGSVDLDQVQSRVELFSDTLKTSEWVPPDSWSQLLEHFSEFAGRVGAITSSA